MTSPSTIKTKFTEETVRAARVDRANGMELKALAAKYEVGYGTMYRALKRQSWKHVK